MKIITMPRIVLRDPELSNADKYTCLVLSHFYNIKNKNAFPSLKKMAEVGGLSEAQYCRGVAKLEEKKYITVKKLPGQTYKRNCYHFTAGIMDNFIQVPAEMLEWVRKGKVSYQSLVFYGILKDVQYKNVNKFEKLSKSKLAEECGCERKTLVKNLEALDNAFIIDYQNGKSNKNIFSIDFAYDKQCGLFMPRKDGDIGGPENHI